MVKLSNSIGATNISQSTRLVTPLSSSLFEITHSEFVDNETMMRFFPFTDLEYNSAEAAARDNIIASARVPMVAHVSAPGGSVHSAIRAPPKLFGRSALSKIVKKGIANNSRVQLEYLITGAGAADYILGISPAESADSLASSKKNTANDMTIAKKRDALWAASDSGVIDASRMLTPEEKKELEAAKPGQFDLAWDDQLLAGTTGPSLQIVQCITENEAIEVVSSDVRLRTVAYVIGPRDVQLYFSDSVIGGMVRRLRHLIERMGPCNPHHWPIGLGHVSDTADVDKFRAQATPITNKGVGNKGGRTKHSSKKLKVAQPTWGWSAGAIGWKSGTMPASGQMYMPDDYIPYNKRKRSYKFNHLMTQVGAEMIDVLQAVGIEMKSDLTCFEPSDKMASASSEVIALLQVMYSDPLMFGTTDNPDVGDVMLDESSLTTAVKSMMGMFFDSAHTHVDPGCLTFQKPGSAQYTDDDGYLSDTITKDLCWKNAPISPKGLMREFISRYIVFLLTAAAMRPYFKVPVFPMHLLYYGGPKPELVTEQLLMNFRPDWDFGGSSGLPFSLIPTRLNPGEIAVRIPTLFDSRNNFNMRSQANLWLGPREPVVFTDVEEVRFRGNTPQSVIEKENYYFSPVIEADSYVSGTYRNHRNVTVAHLSRPTYYTPGCNNLGWILGTMSDNSRVQGPQYILPGTNGYSNEGLSKFVTTDGPAIYRPMTNNLTRDNAKKLIDNWPTQKAQSEEEQAKLAIKMEGKEIKPRENRQTVGEKAGGKLTIESDLARIQPESLGGNDAGRDNI